MPNAFYGRKNGDFIILDEKEIHHLKVLRKNVRDNITVFTGDGYVFECEILKLGKKEGVCRILEEKFEGEEFFPELEIYIGASSQDRIFWLIEKVVELRVNSIYIYNSKKSKQKFKSNEKFKRKVIESCKQSYLPKFPKIDIIPIEKIKGENFIFLDLKSKRYLRDHIDQIASWDKVKVIVGSEYGLDEDEIDKFREMSLSINLGKSIFRFETAAIYMLSVLNFYFKRLEE